MCGLERGDFEKEGLNFQIHKEVDHDIWKYLNYILYLDGKPDNEFDGNEIYVWEQFLEGSTAWIPQNRTIFLGNHLTCINSLIR